MEAATAKSVNRDGSINSLSLADPDVFDCPICYKLLSIPVYQCENGHVVCSTCRKKIDNNKCPSCRSSAVNNRNIAIEKVMESVRVTCKNAEYGCKETTSLQNKCDHEKTCVYAPSSCPLSDCKFLGSSTQLYQHLNAKHNNPAMQFKYDDYFNVSINANEEFVALQEEKDDSVLFMLHNKRARQGRSLTIICICSRYIRKRYKIRARLQSDYTLELGSITSSLNIWSDYPSLLSSLRVPNVFYAINRQLHLEIYIDKDILPD